VKERGRRGGRGREKETWGVTREARR